MFERRAGAANGAAARGAATRDAEGAGPGAGAGAGAGAGDGAAKATANNPANNSYAQKNSIKRRFFLCLPCFRFCTTSNTRSPALTVLNIVGCG